MKTILYLITNTQTWTVFEKYIYAIKFTFFIVQKSNAKYLARRYYIILCFNSIFQIRTILYFFYKFDFGLPTI